MLFDLLQAAGIDSASMAEAAAQASDVIVPQQEEMHLLDMAMKGGWLMLVLLALSIVAIYIFGKKWWMIHQAGNIDNNLLSSGIYTAMITTVGGLIVGILAYFGYNYLTSNISDLVFKMENATIDFMDLLHEPAEDGEAEVK